jgi:hypothetical protein
VKKALGIDDDLAHLIREQVVEEVVKLREGIRAHRDSMLHELCRHHPQLWGAFARDDRSATRSRTGRSPSRVA